MKYYFAYGSNLDVEQMKIRCPDSELVGESVLNGYKLAFTAESKMWGGGVADIVVNNGSEVWGVLYKVSDNDLTNLDRYEGVPDLYNRINVVVAAKNGTKFEAVSYGIVDKQEFVQPSTAYLSIILKAAKKFKFPNRCVKFIEGFKNV